MPPLTLLLFAAVLPTVCLMDQKALDEFVNFPDSHYKYEVKSDKETAIYVAFRSVTIHMTSQKWLDESEVDNPIWSHEINMAVPKLSGASQLANSCLLLIVPGQNDEWRTTRIFNFSYPFLMAVNTKSIAAILSPVPFQPLTFYNHPLGRENITGYDIVAYTWWKFINDPTTPPHELVQFPMVKAVVRAMDTITDFMKKTYNQDITRFTLAGISLGGWASWLTAAVDPRVIAIAPAAMNFLNFTESFHHQYRAYCGWSYKLRPFYEMNITQELDNPRFSELASHVDPMEYNERYANVRKYIIIVAGNEMFPPDNTRYYFSQLEGKKAIHIIPSTDNETKLTDAIWISISTFYPRVYQGHEMIYPVYWNISMTNTSVTMYFSSANVNSVHSFHADTVDETRRDFRTRKAAGNSSKKKPVKWIKTSVGKLNATGPVGRFKKEMPMPKKGWRGFFLQGVYPAYKIADNFLATSEMIIMPDTFPCSDCNGDGCRGTLV